MLIVKLNVALEMFTFVVASSYHRESRVRSGRSMLWVSILGDLLRTRISRIPARLLKINAEWIILPDRQQARRCHVMISLLMDARISVYIRPLDSQVCTVSVSIHPHPPSSSQPSKAQSTSHHNTDSFLFTIKPTDKMKFSALVSALFVAFAAAACKDGEYSWYV